MIEVFRNEVPLQPVLDVFRSDVPPVILPNGQASNQTQAFQTPRRSQSSRRSARIFQALRRS